MSYNIKNVLSPPVIMKRIYTVHKLTTDSPRPTYTMCMCNHPFKKNLVPYEKLFQWLKNETSRPKIDLNGGKISYQEFSVLLKGGASLNLKSVKAKPYKWMLDVTWLNICELRKIDLFNEVLTQVFYQLYIECA